MASNPVRPAPDLGRLLAPAAVAIVGASEHPSSINGQPLRFMLERGYAGGLYPINPKRSEVFGRPAYPDLGALPQPCDVAVVAVAGTQVPQVLMQCGAAGIPFAVVLSAGFGEIGAPGMALQRELEDAIAKSGVRVVGPNCVGVANLASGAILAFGGALNDKSLRPGPIAIVSQSGGVGLSMLAHMQACGLGVSYLVSAGNETDLGLLDFVDHMLDRADVGVVVVYLESTTEGRRLREIGRRALAAGKPILIMKTGNGGAARRAAASHTGRMTADYELFRMAFREGGYIEIDDVDELGDIARAALAGRLPRGANVGVLTVTGGWGVMVTEQCERQGLALPALTDATLARLRELVPAYATLGNPVDMTPQGYRDQYRSYNQITEVMLADPNVDTLIARSGHGPDIGVWADRFLEVYAASDKPVVVNWGPAPHMYVETRQRVEAAGVACISFAGRCARTVGAITTFASARRAAEARAAALEADARKPIDLPLAPNARGTLDERASRACLAACGIAGPRERFVSAAEIDIFTLADLSGPLAVKLVSPDIPHKTEAGGVRLGLRGIDEVRAAAHAVLASAARHAPAARLDGVLVQEMATGVEVIVGAVSDPAFGPYVLFGLGGVLTEVLHDVARRFAPLTPDDARAMIGSIRGARVLEGHRGAPPCDLEALAKALVNLSRLIADHADRIAEIDVNPLFVRARGEGVVAADALVVLRD